MTIDRSAHRLFVSAAAVLLSGGVLTGCSETSPEQPIAFSHRAHVENQVDCSFCHDYYEDYDVAGIPRVEVCVDCHSLMVDDEDLDPSIQLIFEFDEAGEEVPWVRLYEIPKYAHFSHKWHVRAEVECQTCHGDIGMSDRAVRHMEYDMDWCLGCHEEREASVDCVTCHK